VPRVDLPAIANPLSGKALRSWLRSIHRRSCERGPDDQPAAEDPRAARERGVRIGSVTDWLLR
jgi:hypothetical protein